MVVFVRYVIRRQNLIIFAMFISSLSNEIEHVDNHLLDWIHHSWSTETKDLNCNIAFERHWWYAAIWSSRTCDV